MLFGLAGYSLAIAKNNQPEFGILFLGFSSSTNFIRAISNSLLCNILIFIGFILLFLPGIIISIYLSMSTFIIIDKDKDVFSAIK